jgi:hypothetical protein
MLCAENAAVGMKTGDEDWPLFCVEIGWPWVSGPWESGSPESSSPEPGILVPACNERLID